MSRLITMLLLLRNGFSVGRYIPIEERILKDGELYYNALSASEKGWHEGEEDPELRQVPSRDNPCGIQRS